MTQGSLLTAGFIEKPLRGINKEFSNKLLKDFKKTFQTKSLSTQELNTWLLHYTTFSMEFSNEQIKDFESAYRKSFDSYHDKNLIKLLQKDIQTNKELKETGKILSGFLSNFDKSLEERFSTEMKKLHKTLPDLLKKSVCKNIVFLWDYNDTLRFSFGSAKPFELKKKRFD